MTVVFAFVLFVLAFLAVRQAKLDSRLSPIQLDSLVSQDMELASGALVYYAEATDTVYVLDRGILRKPTQQEAWEIQDREKYGPYGPAQDLAPTDEPYWTDED